MNFKSYLSERAKFMLFNLHKNLPNQVLIMTPRNNRAIAIL